MLLLDIYLEIGMLRYYRYVYNIDTSFQYELFLVLILISKEMYSYRIESNQITILFHKILFDMIRVHKFSKQLGLLIGYCTVGYHSDF